MAKWLDRLLQRTRVANKKLDANKSILRQVVAGSFYRVSSIKGNQSLSDIRSTIDTMRALANDSQIATALAYYATDATTPNSSGQIIWATAIDDEHKDVADIANNKFKEWDINRYARDHILELATVGNLYLPTTEYYKEEGTRTGHEFIALDNNTIRNDSYEIIPSTKLPADTLHLSKYGKPQGYIVEPNDTDHIISYPENSIIHFSMGGLMGDYKFAGRDLDGNDVEYDIQFGTPLMEAATQPTQTLNLLEDALVLSSLTRIVRFINVECGNSEEEEIQATLQEIKDMVEQQLSINTSTGDAQSFVNPQSPNNLIYIPKINGADAISITDMNMSEATDADNKLLNYYQDKKLSVLGVPKEAMNFSSAEGLGGAGAVMSQRSALYGNSLQRLETAYKEGWRSALNKYFIEHSLSGMVDTFELHMNPIVTQLSTVNSDRISNAISQCNDVINMLQSLGVTDGKTYKAAITEILSEVLPATGSDVNSWNVDINTEEGGGGGF